MLRPDPHPRVAPRTGTDAWLGHVLVAAALLPLTAGFATVIEDGDWRVTTALVTIMTAATCGVLRTLGVRLVPVFALVVEFVTITWIFVPETLWTILPTRRTFERLADLLSTARDIIIEERAPVAAAQPIVLLLAGSFGLLVVVADVALQRKRSAVLIGLLLLAVFVTPALIAGDNPELWIFLVVAALWLVLLRSRTSTQGLAGRSSVAALVVGAAALLASVAFAAVSPDVSAVASSWGKPPPTVFGRGINPMLELGQNLRRNSTAQALTYTTTLDEAQYLKVATLRDFTGKTWRPARGTPGPLEGELGIVGAYDVERADTTITIKRLRSPFLPVPYPALGTVAGLEGDWAFQTPGMTLMSSEDDSRGQTYTVPSLDIRPTAEEMRELTTFVGPQLQPYVELPENLPESIATAAFEVTADADNDYDRILALQSWFRNNGGFRYSETAPVAEDYDGNGVDVVAKFLEVKAGYCVHFSSAMAVMSRVLGIPARIAVGYAPGARIGTVEGEDEYEATSDDLHAWTEIYFQGVGWTRFDPTTSIGSATRFEEPKADTPEDTAEDEPAPSQQNSRRPDQIDSAAPEPTEAAPASSRTALGVGAGLIVLAASPWVARVLRRRWRLSRGKQDVEPLWRELQDVVQDFGVGASAADTPRGFASRLRSWPQIDVAALDALLQRVEVTRFSRGQAPDGDGVADLEAVVASIRAGATPRQRVTATLLPRSLAGRPAVVRDAATVR